MASGNAPFCLRTPLTPLTPDEAIESRADGSLWHIASGAEMPAKRYVLTGDLDVELWYDVSDTWAGMRFSVDDGSVISYERM